MKKEFHTILPTFAADYSGVCSLLYELGGTVVLHDPSGCMGNFAAYDEPRAYEGGCRLFTSALDDMQALFGLDDQLVEAACQAQEQVKGAFVAVVGTPNPMVLGTDYDAIAEEIGRRSGVPALAFHTTGLRYYNEGIAEALLKIARDLVAPRCPVRYTETRGRLVNLLGATPLDLSNRANVDAIRAIVESAGWEVASCWAMGSDLDELGKAFAADCNIVLTTSAIPLARWLHAEYGLPFVLGSFAGEAGVASFLSHLEEVVAGKAKAIALHRLPAEHSGGRNALIIGDQVLSDGFRHSLELDRGYSRVDVASFFSIDEELARRDDRGFVSESGLFEKMRSGLYDTVVGDGLLRSFLSPAQNASFVEVPHAAVSSRISWDSTIRPFGPEFLNLVDSVNAACSCGRMQHE